MLAILVTPTFSRAVKNLRAKEKIVVDKAVKLIASDPLIGAQKKGDLAGIFIHKLKVNKQEVLLSYQLHADKISPESVMLLSIGSHENFYTD